MNEVSKILEAKTHELLTIDAGVPVIEAVRRMVEANVGSLLVTEDGEIVGIVTERDYLRRVALEGRDENAAAVREIMSSPLVVVVVGYVLAAGAFTWPLPLHLGTHFTGDPGGDTGVYVWNQWVFHQELTTGHNPLATEKILSLTSRVDLTQHNYTAFLNLLALPLISPFGVVAAFNLVFLLVCVLNALLAYGLIRRATAVPRFEAFLGGLVFAWAPAMVARVAITSRSPRCSMSAPAKLLTSLSAFMPTTNTVRRGPNAACNPWARRRAESVLWAPSSTTHGRRLTISMRPGQRTSASAPATAAGSRTRPAPASPWLGRSHAAPPSVASAMTATPAACAPARPRPTR